MTLPTLLSQDRLEALAAARITLDNPYVPGDIAEVGVYQGGSLQWLADHFPKRDVWGFDTWEGLPVEYFEEEEVHSPEDFNDADYERCERHFSGERFHLMRGLFPDVAEGHVVESRRFALVHLDVDYGASLEAALLWFWPRMSPGGMIFIDDYGWPKCPNVKPVTDTFAISARVGVDKPAQWQAMIKKSRIYKNSEALITER